LDPNEVSLLRAGVADDLIASPIRVLSRALHVGA
jgi:hypothetical protein